ncbi:hypothetical protein NEOLI_003005 [Neolecta irregularis DAH-3]|uniref:Protein transport protein SEC22 n=1 Tax=Neolecta irregularis (strain DAH-3) TaxID=1198029 RepID=A0A1U7LHZ3_NEOID|nr:hypothetical protein NEOLI_003005 [Neolecta irregularis DAH-3]|eukprot:OLL22264.1 hypothetical protein NEOLI_003005 [Neolecta irregularis DAH-3]
MSIRSTSISRLPDGLPLAASVDDAQAETDLAEYKRQIKLIIRKLTPTSEPRASIESGPYYIHYLVENNICYTVITDRSLPRKVAFGYMQDLASEFYSQFAQEMENPRLRAYAFVQFGTI